MSIYVVGIGPGAKEYILPVASQIIEGAHILIAGERTLEQFQYLNKESFTIKNNLQELIDYIKTNHKLGKKIAILASGDPGMFGILRFLKKHFDVSQLTVIPGISSVQYAMSKLAISWDDAKLLTCHGRDVEQLAQPLKMEKKAVILTDPRRDLEPLAKIIFTSSDKVKVYQCSDLSYQSEVVKQVTYQELCTLNNYKNLILVVLHEE